MTPASRPPMKEEEMEEETNYTKQLEKALAECRDVFQIPEPGGDLEEAWAQAMGDPIDVPAYVRASLAAASGMSKARIHHPGTSCRHQNVNGQCGCPSGCCAQDRMPLHPPPKEQK
jgi:hypothetical protein